MANVATLYACISLTRIRFNFNYFLSLSCRCCLVEFIYLFRFCWCGCCCCLSFVALCTLYFRSAHRTHTCIFVMWWLLKVRLIRCRLRRKKNDQTSYMLALSLFLYGQKVISFSAYVIAILDGFGCVFAVVKLMKTEKTCIHTHTASTNDNSMKKEHSQIATEIHSRICLFMHTNTLTFKLTDTPNQQNSLTQHSGQYYNTKQLWCAEDFACLLAFVTNPFHLHWLNATEWWTMQK